jgi:hypothetical protein
MPQPCPNQEFVAYLNKLSTLASHATRGPYFASGWVDGPRGFEVGSEKNGRPRVCSDITENDAAYLAELSPEKMQTLIAWARTAVPEITRMESD